MKRTHALAAALLLSLTLVLAGCGSDSGSDSDVASAGGKNSSGSKDSDDSEDGEDQGLNFARCMREHGVEMEDPKGGRITIKGRPGQEGPMREAQEACQKYLPQISDADRKAANEQGLKFSRCMREKGVENFPDPKNGMMRMREDIAKDPDFQKAQEACQKYMGGKMRTGEKR